MKRFATKCFILAFTLFIGVLAGMQLANDGLKRMKGYNDPTFEQVAHITNTKSGDTEASLLGKTFTIEEKEKQLENMKSFNVLSKLGDTVAIGVQKVTRFSTDAVVGKIQDIFQELSK
ncbi:YqxA family protein [Ectobacillus panaciterrae]|uniref:YqxA family protein n=1 Tax=Ectobacillus panaciterrae TaxID=363872 RepID=UPI000428BE4F|nr:YqxA family protein [Ectobacillus panaciterrae]